MKKFEEFTNESSCFNRARSDEMLFVLLARDASAPVAVRAWINHRLITGKNRDGDPQIEEARRIADEMERYRISGTTNRSTEK